MAKGGLLREMFEHVRRRWAGPGPVLLCLAVLGLLGCVRPAGAQAAEESCRDSRGGQAVVDWGMNASEQVGAGFASDYENSPQPVEGLAGVTQVKAGFKFGLAVLGDCKLEAWGTGNKGQLGDGLQQTESHPVAVAGLSEVKEVAVANAHAMALLYNGTVWTWGASEFGERGNREKGWERTARQSEPWFVARDRPTQVPALSAVRQIAAGGTRDYALLSNGEVMAWGDDQKGQLGVEEGGGEEELCYGETHAITPIQCSTVPRPVKVAGLGVLSGVERIAAGEESAYAIRSGGREVIAWGAGSRGQLGDGSTQESASPVRVSFEPASPVVEMAAGSQQVLARLADGEVYGWGADSSGQLGFETGGESSESCGRAKCSTVPLPVSALNHIVAVAAGEAVSFAVKEEESASRVIYSFGGTGFFELLGLGDQNLSSTSTPTPVEGLASVRGVSASTTTAVALLQGQAVAPRISLSAAEEELTVSWKVKAEHYKVRNRPVGTREFSSTKEGSCKGECSIQFTGLKPEPYEVTLRTPEGREGKEKVRKIFGSPLPSKTWPVNTSPPTIAGSPATETGKLRLGQKLTVSHGSWSGAPSSFTYQWLRCEGNGEAGTSEELGAECEPITTGSEKQLATGESYEVQPQDVASTIEVRVEARNEFGWSAAVSDPEMILGAEEESEPPYPIPIAPPTLSGEAVEGQTLTAHHGSWEYSPTGYEDKWLRCKGRTKEGVGATCSAIKVGAEPVTGETYKPVSADVGEWVEVLERAENPGGYEISASQAVQIAPQAPPSNVTPPSVTGTVEQGQVLTAQEGTWANAPNRASWQWLRCSSGGGECQPIGGATKQSYTLVPEDVGHTVRVSETTENDVGRSEAATSAASEVVPTPPPSPPEASSPPTITGTPEQGQTLTADPASWSGEVKRYAYQWKRCDSNGQNCNAVPGGNESTYTLRAADVGHRMVMKETASNATGSGVASSAATSAVVGAVPVSLAPPTTRGGAAVGQSLSDLHGSWSNEPTSYAYQWARCDGSGEHCEAIAGATGKSYVPVAADEGMRLRVEETARNATGAGAPASSAATAQVLAQPPVNTAPPTISGTASQGETLTAHAGSWSNSPTRLADQWMRCEEGECSAIAGATGAEYTLSAADVGYSVAVRESAANSGGFAAALSEADSVGGPAIPFVSSVEPSAGPTEGGTVVTITGGNFARTIAVSFGFAAAASYEILSPTVLRATAPAASAGTVAVTVTTEEGTSAVSEGSRFTYGPPPQASAIAPREGPESGGTTVTITGSNLSEATAVRFGAAEAESFGVQSANKVTAVAPAGTGTVGVTVQTPFGTTTAGSSEQFTYVHTGAAPVVRKLSVKKGPAAGGTILTITGSGFINAVAVSFGSQRAASFEVLTQSAISATAPPGTSGTVDVTVTNPFGTSATGSADHFKYENPTVASITPASGPKAGGTEVTVTGSGFAPGEGATSFLFGKAAASSVECASTGECTMLTPKAAKPQAVKVKASANGEKSKPSGSGDVYTYR